LPRSHRSSGIERTRRASPAPRAVVIRSAMQLASDELGLRLAIEATVGKWYRIEVGEGAKEVRLVRRDSVR
jgi:hypothetical protein